MSKLEELIQRYCPDGVEWHPFFDVCDLIRGITYSKEQETKTQTGDAHKVLRANNITLHLNTLNFEDVKLVSRDVVVKPAQHLFAGDILMCAGSGSKEHVGKVAFIPVDMDYTFGGFMAVVRCKKTILPRFVYHILTSGYFSNHLEVQINSSTINNINKQVMQSFELPVPPLPVQEEIVRVLDTFTELQAELQAELQKRLQQYNYYRDNLLSFDGRTDVEWKRLGDICKKVCSGGTPSRGNGDYFKGNIPWLRTQEVDWSDIYDTEIKITEGAVKKSSAKLIPENCVIVAMYGATAGKAAINKIPLTTNQACCNLQIDSNKALYKYVYYCVCNEYEQIKALGQGSQNNINAQIVKDYLIPVPPLAEQQRIVDILDRFDSLTNDLTAGVPAEIEKRRQQYEFYRDKLLTIKRKEA